MKLTPQKLHKGATALQKLHHPIFNHFD